MNGTTMPATATTLWERMIEDMNLPRLCRTTQHGIMRFAIWLGRPPDTATDEDLRRSLGQAQPGKGLFAQPNLALSQKVFVIHDRQCRQCRQCRQDAGAVVADLDLAQRLELFGAVTAAGARQERCALRMGHGAVAS